MREENFKPIVIGVTLLMIGLVIQPAVSTNEIKTQEVEPKEYVFESIIDIAKNPDVKNFLNNIDPDDINLDINIKGVFFKLLLKNPSIITSMLFTKPALSNKYLTSSYDLGIKISKIIGEEKSLNIVKTLMNKNPEVINDLSIIFNNNQEISQRISILGIMNNEVNPDEPFADTPVICAIFCGMTVMFVINAILLLKMAKDMGESSPLYQILISMVDVMIDIALINAGIAAQYGCWEDFPG